MPSEHEAIFSIQSEIAGLTLPNSNFKAEDKISLVALGHDKNTQPLSLNVSGQTSNSVDSDRTADGGRPGRVPPKGISLLDGC